MTAQEFRRLALELDDATESSHMAHPDFRRNGKVFATLHYPDENWGMVKLTPEEQDDFLRRYPKAFFPVKGAWGRQGSTNVLLESVEPNALERALSLAWARAGAKTRTPKRK